MNRVQKLPHIRSEPASSSSKMDPLLAKAKSVSNVGFYSVRANIRNLNKQTTIKRKPALPQQLRE